MQWWWSPNVEFLYTHLTWKLTITIKLAWNNVPFCLICVQASKTHHHNVNLNNGLITYTENIHLQHMSVTPWQLVLTNNLTVSCQKWFFFFLCYPLLDLIVTIWRAVYSICKKKSRVNSICRCDVYFFAAWKRSLTFSQFTMFQMALT